MLFKNKGLLVIFITTFVDLVGFGLVIPILPLYAKDLGTSDWVIGILIGTFSLMQFIFASFWGSLSDRYGRRPIILISTLIMAFSYVIFSQANTLFLLFLARALSGFGGANIGVAQAYISDVVEPEDRARAFAFIGAAFGLGFIVGPLIGGQVEANYGFEWVGYSAALFSVLNFFLALIFLRESIEEKDTTTPIKFNPLSDVMEGFKRPIVRQLMAINLVFITAFAMMQGTAALLWNEVYSLNQEQVANMFAFIGLVAFIIQGGLIGVIGKWLGEHTMLVWGNILVGVGLLGMPFVPEAYFFPLEYVCMILISLGIAFLSPTINSLISKVASSKEQGKLLGTNQSVGSFARILGPFIGGMLYGVDEPLPYIFAFFIMLGTGVMSARLVKTLGE